MSDSIAVHLVIHGRVQGVGYRAWTGSIARKAGVKGWVRNRSAGTVEAVLIGERDIVERMIDACANGPLNARVDQIDRAEWNDLSALSVTDFRQVPTV